MKFIMVWSLPSEMFVCLPAVHASIFPRTTGGTYFSDFEVNALVQVSGAFIARW